MIEKYAFMPLSHHEASDGLAENGAGKAILITPVEVEVPVVGWVDMGFEGLTGVTGGAKVRVTIVAGLTEVGMWGNKVLDNWGVTTTSRGLLGFRSRVMASGSQLRWKRRLEMVARMDGSCS